MTRAGIEDYFTGLGSLLASDKQRLSAALDEYHATLFPRLLLRDRARQEDDLRFATRFNVLTYIDPDERTLSRILRDLLDPAGPHGQGPAFLEEFLKLIDHSEACAKAGTAHVDTETFAMHARDGGFIDITIDLGDFGVGIENKPRAGEQRGQLERYRQDLDRHYRGNFCLVFLTQEGRQPETIDPATRQVDELDGRFRVLFYSSHLRRWLNECEKLCRSDNVRCFLHNFVQWTGGESAMTTEETNLIMDHALASEEHLRVSIKVALTFDELRHRVILKFLLALEAELKEALGEGWIVTVNREGYYPEFRRSSWPKQTTIGVGSDSTTSFSQVYFWVGRCGAAIGNTLLDEDLKAALDSRFGAGKATKSVAWFQFVDRLRNWGDEDALLELYREDAARDYRRYLTTRLLELSKITSSVIDPALPASA